MGVDGSNPVNLTHNAFMDAVPRWSPDGEHIAFFSNRDGNEEIYVMNDDGTDQRRITNTPYDEEFPAWAPGERLAFNAYPKKDAIAWYLLNLDGSDLIELTQLTNAGAVNFIDWMP